MLLTTTDLILSAMYTSPCVLICEYLCLEVETRFLNVTIAFSFLAPAQLRPPVVKEINSTTIHSSWLPPEEVNGPSPQNQLERRELSFPALMAARMKGIHFMGNEYCEFSSTAHPVGRGFAGKCV